jgi:hypothetical protein
MAKKKDKRNIFRLPLEELTPAEHRRRMALGEVETYVKHKTRCWICGEKETERDVTEVQFIKALYTEGWRIIESEKFQAIGIACPKCVKTPDEDRGED